MGIGVGFCELLAIVLITLKLLGKVTLAWKWIIILALMPWIIIVSVLTIGFLIAGIIGVISAMWSAKKDSFI